MTEIRTDRSGNIPSQYPTDTENKAEDTKKLTTQSEDAINAAITDVENEIDLQMQELIAKNPRLQASFNSMTSLGGDPGMSGEDIFTMQSLITALIDLGQALQLTATSYADRLAKVTEKMTAYSKMLGQIPVVTKGQVKYDGDDQAQSQRLGTLNQKFGAMLEVVRANKGLEEDKAKKIQTIMQTMKDAGQSANDFIGTFIDLLRGISQKIMK